MPETRFKIFAPMLKTSIGTDGRRRLHGVASSTIKDRHGDTMNLSALSDMERTAANNMTIFLNHSYDVPEDVAGTVEFAKIHTSMQDPDIHDLALDILVNEANERAVKAWEAINGGTKLGLSIGAMIPDGGATRDRKSGAYSIDHVELLETSLVGVPANPRSWVEYAVKSLDTGRDPHPWPDGFVVGKGSNLDDDLDAEHMPEPEPTEETDGISETDANPEGDARVAAEDEARIEADEEAGLETGTDAKLDYVDITTFGSSTSTYHLPGVQWTPTPDVTDATVSITTPYADINIDTGNRGGKPAAVDGSSQEAPVSAPENEDEAEAEALANPWAAIGLGESEADLTAALQMLEPTVVTSLTTSSQLLQAITRELVTTKAALADVTEERDAALRMAQQAIEGTADILESLSKTPVGRRAVVREASDKLTGLSNGLSNVYGDDVLTLLKKG